MRLVRTNTAIRITVGPFLDPTDGVTPKTSLTVTNCHLTLMVDDSNVPTLVLDTSPTASGGNNDMVHVTGDDAGFYDLELTAANLNYLGRAMLALTDATNHCPVFHELMIVPAMIYDSFVLGTDDLDTNTKKWNDLTTVALPLIPTTAGRTLDVSATGEAGVDWGNVGSPTTTVGLSGTTVKTATDVETDTQDIQSRLPAALTGDGNIKADTLRVGGTLQTARDLGASVLISSGTGTGQLLVSSGVISADAVKLLGTAISTPGTAGILDVNVAKIGNNVLDITIAQIGVNVTKFGNVAITSSSGIPSVRVAAMDNNTLTAAATATDFTTEVMGGNPTVQDVVDGIFNQLASAYTTAGTFGDYLRRMFLAGKKVVVGSGSDTTHVKFSTVEGSSPSATDDFYNGRVLIFITGALAGQGVSITGYVGSTTTATISTATGSASSTDQAMMV